jgi:hypothetical protein
LRFEFSAVTESTHASAGEDRPEPERQSGQSNSRILQFPSLKAQACCTDGIFELALQKTCMPAELHHARQVCAFEAAAELRYQFVRQCGNNLFPIPKRDETKGRRWARDREVEGVSAPVVPGLIFIGPG